MSVGMGRTASVPVNEDTVLRVQSVWHPTFPTGTWESVACSAFTRNDTLSGWPSSTASPYASVASFFSSSAPAAGDGSLENWD